LASEFPRRGVAQGGLARATVTLAKRRESAAQIACGRALRSIASYAVFVIARHHSLTVRELIR
jgi:hypothetical protein